MSVETINTTEHAVFDFEHMLFRQLRYQIVILKQSWQLMPGGGLRPLPVPRGIRLNDEYFGDPRRTALLAPSDLVPYKPHNEVIVTGMAQVATARPSWLAGIAVGEWTKVLTVHGPRHWERSRLGKWSLSAAEPTTSTPLSSDMAFGGSIELPAAQQQGDKLLITCADNPAGTGWLGSEPGVALAKHQKEALRDQLAGLRRLQAPRLEFTDRPIGQQPGGSAAVAGFGAFAAWSAPRLRHLDKMKPVPADFVGLPDDFNKDHWQQAPADQWLPNDLQGGERIVMMGLLPEERASYTLPRSKFFLSVHGPTTLRLNLDMDIDTLVIDTQARVLEVIHRRIVRLDLFGDDLTIEVIALPSDSKG